MKKIILSAFCAIMMALCTTPAFAQVKNTSMQKEMVEKREQMAEAHAKHICSQLALDDVTSQKFIATYIDYQKEVWAMKKDFHQNHHKEMTEAEAEKNIKDQMERKRKMLDLREKYYKKYSQFLTQKQIQRVYEIEKRDMKRLAAGNKGRGHRHHHGQGHRPQQSQR